MKIRPGALFLDLLINTLANYARMGLVGAA
jgi:hypothetical protein